MHGCTLPEALRDGGLRVIALHGETVVAISTFPGVILFAFTLIRTGQRAVIRNIVARGLPGTHKKHGTGF